MVQMIPLVASGTVQLVHCTFASPSWMVYHPTCCISGKLRILTNFSNRHWSVSQKATVLQTRPVLQRQSPPGFVVGRMLLNDRRCTRQDYLNNWQKAWTESLVYKKPWWSNAFWIESIRRRWRRTELWLRGASTTGNASLNVDRSRIWHERSKSCCTPGILWWRMSAHYAGALWIVGCSFTSGGHDQLISSTS